MVELLLGDNLKVAKDVTSEMVGNIDCEKSNVGGATLLHTRGDIPLCHLLADLPSEVLILLRRVGLVACSE